MRRFRRNDVSAVVLTTGEPTAGEAIDSLNRQTLPPNEVVIVADTRPFHRALNEGARRVRTPFFIQVDADMRLDPSCIARLRRSVGRDTGIVVGQLRDALIGRVVGVKLFRTACFAEAQFPNTISPDTDFGAEIASTGWKTVYVGKPKRSESDAWETFGEHRPSYTPRYTFEKYVLEGARYRHRGSLDGIRWHFSRLEDSRHPSAVVAQIALAHGIFVDIDQDMLGRESEDEFAKIETFLTERGDTPGRTTDSRTVGWGASGAASEDAPVPGPDAPLQEVFEIHYRTGADLLHNGTAKELERALASLGPTRRNDAAWIAKVAICQGLVSASSSCAQGRMEQEWRLAKELLDAADSDHNRASSALGRLVQAARRALWR